MVDVELSCGLPPGPDFADLAVLAEELGYARVWIFDSAPLWEDPFVHLALAAARTTRDRLGYGCPDPVATFRDDDGVGHRDDRPTIKRPFQSVLRHRLHGSQDSRPAPDVAKRAVRLRRYAPPGARRRDRPHRWQGGSDASLARNDGLSTSERAHLAQRHGATRQRAGAEVADGIIGPPHPTLPTATMLSGTVLDPGEDPHSSRVLRAVGPWAVVSWHTAYTHGGASAVDAMPGGAAWRAALEALAPQEERHLLTYEGHVTHLSQRDLPLLEHIDGRSGAARMIKIGDPASIRHEFTQLGNAGFREVMYNPSGPDRS